MGKWNCLKCGWEGDHPNIAHPEYEDGGWKCCPNGCQDDDGEPLGVVLNDRHLENIRWFARMLSRL